ncbi:MAG: phosphodiester glycosidase family protein, partial [Actinobacteria bacterium]|nr:phosphodiester glycosidase family protein [Actinomycetota bacterium]
EDLLASGVWNTLSFGPAIVEDGQVVDGIDSVEVDTNVGNHSIQGDQPRTAVGVIDENHLVFVVVDGRQEGYSEGVTLPELADIMLSLSATTAYNLDGGGSSTMYFNGEVVNSPSNGGERGTSDILYVAG